MSEAGIIESLTRRVEELEKRNLWNFAYLSDGWNGLDGKGWVIDQGLAMAIMQAVPKGFPTPRTSVSVNDPSPTRWEIPSHFKIQKRGDGFEMTMMVFDPDASPPGIPFEVALMYLKTGREVRRRDWRPSSLRVEPRGPGGVGGLCMVYGASLVQGDFHPVSLEDLLATDWLVIPKEEKK